MKLRLTASLLLLASVAIISCSKDDTPKDPTQNATGSLFVRIQQGLLPENDTVYFISYDANKHIKSIVDSVYKDSLTATYNTAGNPISTLHRDDTYSETTDFEYNADNQLTAVNYDDGYYKEEHVFEYTNGVLSKKSFSTNSANGTETTLWRSYTYVVTNGNITSRKEYDKVGTLLGETTYTYTSDANVFKQISLFNSINLLGFDDLANYEVFSNKNLIATSTAGDAKTTYTYSYNSNKQLTKVVVSSADAVYTRMLSY